MKKEEDLVLVVAGMHRSGTSLISQWLDVCGLHLGERLLGAATGNKRGHFEDLDFLELHERIFKRCGMPPTGFERLEDLNVHPAEIEAMKKLGEKKSQSHSQWAWKEPRTCLFLKYYKEVFPEAKYLIVYRSPESVVDSLIRRYYKTQEKKIMEEKNIWKRWRKRSRLKSKKSKKINIFLKSWIEYNKQIIELVQSLPKNRYVIYNIDGFNGDEVFQQLTNWGFELNEVPFASCFDQSMMKKNPLLYSYDTAFFEQAKVLETQLDLLVKA